MNNKSHKVSFLHSSWSGTPGMGWQSAISMLGGITSRGMASSSIGGQSSAAGFLAFLLTFPIQKSTVDLMSNIRDRAFLGWQSSKHLSFLYFQRTQQAALQNIRNPFNIGYPNW